MGKGKKGVVIAVAGAAATKAAQVISEGGIKPIIDPIHDMAEKVYENRQKLITVPNLYSKEFSMNIDKAVEILEKSGFSLTVEKVNTPDNKLEYRKCFDGQVVYSDPKPKDKVKPGEPVYVRYVTQDIIDECQRLYDEAEMQKVQAQDEKLSKRTERKEKTKQKAAETFEKVKNGIPKKKQKDTEIEE